MLPILPSSHGIILLLVSTIPPRLGGSGCLKETESLLGLEKRVVVMLTERLVVLYTPCERQHILHVRANVNRGAVNSAVNFCRESEEVPSETVILEATTGESSYVAIRHHQRVELARCSELSHVTHCGLRPNSSRAWARHGSGSNGCSLLKQRSG